MKRTEEGIPLIKLDGMDEKMRKKKKFFLKKKDKTQIIEELVALSSVEEIYDHFSKYERKKRIMIAGMSAFFGFLLGIMSTIYYFNTMT